MKAKLELKLCGWARKETPQWGAGGASRFLPEDWLSRLWNVSLGDFLRLSILIPCKKGCRTGDLSATVLHALGRPRELLRLKLLSNAKVYPQWGRRKVQ